MRLNPVENENSLGERIKGWIPDFSTRTFNFKITIVQIAVYILSILLSGDDTPSICTLMVLGAKFTPLIVNRYQVWRLVTPILLHADNMHIIGNLIFQLRFGFAAEKYYGTRNYFLIYLFSGIGGNLLGAVLMPYSIAIGASTSIFGLLALVGIYSWYNWDKLGPGRDCNMIVYGLFVVYGFLMSYLNPVIDLYGHLGGYLVGGLTGIILINQEESSSRMRLITMICFLAFLAYFSALIVILFNGDYECMNSKCSLCDGFKPYEGK